MGAAEKYSIIDPDTGKIDRRIFSDPAIYDEEMERPQLLRSTRRESVMWLRIAMLTSKGTIRS